MKITTLLLIWGCLHVSAASVSQTITIQAREKPLGQIFEMIRSQTNYKVIYNDRFVNPEVKISISVDKMPLEDFLKKMLSPLYLTYFLKEHTVLIGKSANRPSSEKIVARREDAPVQQITITGTVRDTTGVVIAGATVATLNKSKSRTQTDENGRFVIDASPGTILQITFLGYVDKQVTVQQDTKTLNVYLTPSNTEVDEVVVTAYNQKQTKEAIVGSVTTVKPGNLKIPASNLTNAFAGQIAGIIAQQPSGQPGADNSNFFIRGVTTFGYKKDPLILIDNVELTSSDLARLNVDDIESFAILKDASATALYGARGGNGVILVKTKEGTPGKAQIGFRLESSSSQSVRNLELADPITYMRLFNEATQTRYPLNPLPYTENQIQNAEATYRKLPGSNPYVYPAVGWLDMLFKNRTNTQRGDISLQGGGGVARYYVAGSLSNDNGILRTDVRNNNNNNVKFQNYQLRSNVNINVTSKTELIVRLSGNFNDYNGPQTNDASLSTDLYNLVMHTSPVDFPAYYEPDAANSQVQHILFGNKRADGGGVGSTAYINPYASLLSGHQNFSESRMLAQLEVNQNLDFLTDGLNFHGIFSTNRYARFQSSMAYKPFYYNVSDYDKVSNTYTLQWLNDQPGQAQEYLDYSPGNSVLNTFVYFQAVVDYTHSFGENHHFSASLVGTRQQTVNANAESLFDALPFRNQTLAGRATYAYKGRYYLESNFGYNGSERFSKAHRYGFFPTIGASWIMSEEKFWGNLNKVFDRFKLRASYGLVGNDQIGSQRFFYLSNVNLNGGNSASFGTDNGYSRNGVTINNYENDDVTWETSKQTNIGIEFSLLKKINVIAEFYNNEKYNILQQRASIPATSGLESAISANIGKASSRGTDISIDGKTNIGTDIWLQARGNFTYATNKYTKYEEPNYAEPYRGFEGQMLNLYTGYIAERLFVDDNEARNSPTQIFSTNGTPPKGGDIKYRDLNNDGKIDGADQTSIGNPIIPQVVYGFGFSVGWKKIDLSAFFQGQAKVGLFIDPARTSPFIKSPDSYFTGNTQLLKAYAEDHWSEANQDLYALYPRLGPDGAVIENNRQTSTWWLRDGSFMRLKTLEIGFTLPDKFSKSVYLKQARIYCNGLNLLTCSAFDLWDPEQGGNAFSYPVQKVFNIGINASF